MDLLDESFAEYFSLIAVTNEERTRVLSVHRSDDVVQSATQSGATADAFFIAAVSSAGTHRHIVGDVYSNPLLPSLVDSVGGILRYAKAICDASGLEQQRCASAAFVFSAVRRMCAVGVQSQEIFLALADHLINLIKRLHRVDSQLEITLVGDKGRTSLISALVDIILFCGQVTRFLEGA